MTKKENGKSDEAETEDDISNGSGWLFRKIQEGWLRKRWRRRWCVIRDGKLFFFEHNTSDHSEKNCGIVDLSLYENCVKGTKKEAEKKANLIVLEALKNNKNKSKANREMFYAATSDVMEQWLSKLNEAIAVAKMGGDVKLTHVTKLRAKPAATTRRPPSRGHLKERALTSTLSLEESPSVPLEKKKRGHQPSSAIKPPPSSFKVKSADEDPLPPPADDLPSPLKTSEDKLPDFADTGLPSPPKTGEFPFLPEVDSTPGGEEPDAGPGDDSPRLTPPPPPSKALKPKIDSKNSRPPSPLVPREMLDRCSPTPSRGNSLTGSLRSLSSTGSGENDPGFVQHGSFKRDNVDQRAELLKTKVLLTLKTGEGGSNLTQQHRSRSMAYLDNLDNDLPPPPELPEGYTELGDSAIVKKGKKDKKKKIRRPKSLIFN